MADPQLYAGREQTRVKHEILRRYLARFARIVGSSRWDVISYVDGFSGPWRSQSDRLEDTSFAIAIDELRQARATIEQARGKRIRLRCLFLEAEPRSYAELEAFSASATVEDLEIETLNAEFEAAVPAVVDFIGRGGAQSFPFVFVDPTGWTGYDLERIAAILKLQPMEVLINFMTGHVERFVGSTAPTVRKTFRGIYGDAALQVAFEGLSGLDREDAIVRRFAARLKEIGGFRYVPYAMVLRPTENRAQFHLVYGTRNPKGLEVFKEAEAKAMEEMERGRAEATKRKRERATRMRDLFDAGTMHDTGPFDSRRTWYHDRSRAELRTLTERRSPILYDDLWEALLQRPLVYERDLKAWIADLIASGAVEIAGLGRRERALKRGRGHTINAKKPRAT